MKFAALALATQIDPDDATAAQWASEELAKRKYHLRPSLLERLMDWLNEHLTLRFSVGEGDAGVAILIVILIALLIAITVFAIRRYSRAKTAETSYESPLSPLLGTDKSAEQLRHAAGEADRRSDFTAATIEYFRLAIKLASDGDLIALWPGLTAREAARELGTELGDPALWAGAAAVFNRSFFADREASEADARAMAELAAIVERTTQKHRAKVPAGAAR